jgi:RNA polymerase sigma-70 factor (ECF subfamily)
MQRYCAGDQEAFQLLYSHYRAPLRRFITKLTGNPDEADEIFQEVWTAVIHGRRSYRPTAKFSTHLFSIAHRRLQDRQRRYGRRAAAFDDSNPPPVTEERVDELSILPESCVHNAQLHQALLMAIDALPPLQREVFLLKAETDMTLEEIAAATGAKLEATKSRLRYAVVRLRAQLRDWI